LDIFLHDFVAFNTVVIFRSLNEATSGSLVDRDRFQFRPHDATLEQTADSQEKNQDDAALKELSKQSPPKKDGAKQDFILVTSSSGPSEPARHVSSSFNLLVVY
jgi:hypothetical protein